MNCPHCGTYNPEDRTICWRCDKELPKPKPKKERNPQTAQIWLYVLVAVFLVFTLAQSCGLFKGFAPQATPSGLRSPRAPLVYLSGMPPGL
jgi:hypothetical protein